MNENAAGRGPRGADLSTRLRVVALVAVITGVILLAAAAFVLAYAGIHAIALAAGVSPTLARYYPLIFDAMLVVASAAALALRGGGWWTKFYAWLSIVVLLAAASAADAVHAMGVSLPRRPTAAAVAVTPWVLLLLAFGLWLALLRHLRASRSESRRRGNRRDLPGAQGPQEVPLAEPPPVAPPPVAPPPVAPPPVAPPPVAGPPSPAAQPSPAGPPRRGTARVPEPEAAAVAEPVLSAEVPGNAGGTAGTTGSGPDGVTGSGPDGATGSALDGAIGSAPAGVAAGGAASTTAGGLASGTASRARPATSWTDADPSRTTAARHAKESAPAAPKATFSGLATFTAHVTDDSGATNSGDAEQIGRPADANATEPAGAGHASDAAGSVPTSDTGSVPTSDTGSVPTGDAASSGQADDAKLALDAEPDLDDPTSDEAHPADGTATARVPADHVTASDDPIVSAAEPAEPGSDVPADDEAGQQGPVLVPRQPLPASVPAPSPHFDRMRSAPTPPEEEPEQET